MTYDNRTNQSKNNDLHTVNKSKETGITIDTENHADKKTLSL